MALPTEAEWAEATAMRLATEWGDLHGFPNDDPDVRLLQETLAQLFFEHPDACRGLRGMSIIEENFFDGLDET